MPAPCWEVICKRPVDAEILGKPEPAIIRLMALIVTPYWHPDAGSGIASARKIIS
jgi:hypothetical protein